MVTPNQQIQPYREEDVPKDDRFLKKEREKIPNRDFSKVADQLDERRTLDEDIKKKKLAKKAGIRQTKPDDENEGQPSPSLFDLARGARKGSKEEGEEADLAASNSSKSKKAWAKEPKPFDMMEGAKDDSKFMREQPDLSYVNPLAAATPSAALNTSLTANSAASGNTRSVQEIIDQIVKEIYTLEKNGKTDTVISLKGPIFDNAHLILSEFDTAKGQFNITFDNLTQAGKDLLDKNQQLLLDDLSKKGYVVHMVVSTTTIETPQVDSSQLTQEDRGQKEEQGEQKQNKQQKQFT